MKRAIDAAFVLRAALTTNGAALAQDPCATLTSQGTSLSVFAGAKVEAGKSGNNTICETWSKDRKATLRLIVEPPQAAGGMAMRKMPAANAKDPGM